MIGFNWIHFLDQYLRTEARIEVYIAPLKTRCGSLARTRPSLCWPLKNPLFWNQLLYIDITSDQCCQKKNDLDCTSGRKMLSKIYLPSFNSLDAGTFQRFCFWKKHYFDHFVVGQYLVLAMCVTSKKYCLSRFFKNIYLMPAVGHNLFLKCLYFWCGPI